jgi:hypothetical protein
MLQGPRSFFSEIISSINDIKFSRDGRYILSRDYMTLKLWDIHMENAPVGVYPVHEVLRGKVRRSMLGRISLDCCSRPLLRLRALARERLAGTGCHVACCWHLLSQVDLLDICWLPSRGLRRASQSSTMVMVMLTCHAPCPAAAVRPVRERLHLRQVRLQHLGRRQALLHRHLLQLLPVRGP